VEIWISAISATVALAALVYSVLQARQQHHDQWREKVDTRLLAIEAFIQELKGADIVARELSTEKRVSELEGDTNRTLGANLPVRMAALETSTRDQAVTIASTSTELEGLHELLTAIREDLRRAP